MSPLQNHFSNHVTEITKCNIVFLYLMENR